MASGLWSGSTSLSSGNGLWAGFVGFSKGGGLSPTGGTPAPTPGVSATVFSVNPTFHFHPNSQTATLGAGDRVESCPDLRGNHPLSAPAGVGPFQLTDALGRKFWRFNGTEWAAIANSLVLASNRGFTVVLVMRAHHQRNTYAVLMPRYATYTSDTVNTRAAAGIGYVRAVVAANSPAYLQAGTPAAITNTVDCYKAIPSCELHVTAIASRTTANGQTRLYHGTQTCDVAQQSTSVSNYVGALIGASPATVDNTTNVVTSVNNTFDIYEIAFFASELVNTTSDALVLEAFTNYGLTKFTNQIVCEGDSITDGVATSLPVSPAWFGGLGSRLTEPGASAAAANTRVINMGQSGSQFIVSSPNLAQRIDSASSWSTLGRIPGAASLNKLFLQCGRNDMGGGGLSGDVVYTDRFLPYLNDAVKGVLPRGWKVIVGSNIATTSAPIQARIEVYRSRFLDPVTLGPLAAFLTDCNAGPGGTYDGLLDVVPLSEITVGGDTMFKTAADSTDTAAGYMDTDGTHVRVAGMDLMISGGDNANRGWGSRV